MGYLVAGEIQTDGWLHEFGLAGWLHVDVQDQICAGVRAPSHAGGFDPGSRAGFPKQKMAVRIEGVRFDVEVHAGETGARSFLLHARGTAAVDEHVRVVHGADVAGADLDSLHPLGRAWRGPTFQGQNEVPVLVRAAGGQMIRFGGLDHQIRLAKLPPGHELRKRWSVSRRTGGRALPHPLLDAPDLFVREPPLFLKISVACLGQPRRHVAPLDYRYDLLAALLHVRVSKQREGPRLARAMARRARVVNDGRDVFVERNGLGLCGACGQRQRG